MIRSLELVARPHSLPSSQKGKDWVNDQSWWKCHKTHKDRIRRTSRLVSTWRCQEGGGPEEGIWAPPPFPLITSLGCSFLSFIISQQMSIFLNFVSCSSKLSNPRGRVRETFIDSQFVRNTGDNLGLGTWTGGSLLALSPSPVRSAQTSVSARTELS